MRRLLNRSSLKRVLFFVFADTGIVWISVYLSFLSNSNFSFDAGYAQRVNEVFLFFAVIKLSFLMAFRVYKLTWRFAGIADMANIFLAVLVSEMVLLVLSLPSSFLPRLPLLGIPKRVFFTEGLLSLGLILMLRISKRVYLEVIRKRGPMHRGDNTLIVGAGNAGEMMLRDIIRNNFREFYPIGFLDDDRTKIGSYIHGVKVLGKTSLLPATITHYKVQTVIIAIPTLNHKTLRRLYDWAKAADVKTVKIVPRIYAFNQPDINMKNLESISIEDLVGRQSVSVDCRGIRSFIRGKSVLVTGAGGSIGSEIVSQICACDPQRVILFDIDETELHNLGLKLRRIHPQMDNRLVYMTGDVRDDLRVREVFNTWQPEIVFHAAAYKHVPMMEFNPKEAVKVNIFGTFIVASAAKNQGVEKFIMISTDKAVRPTSVMGATKRMAEFICNAFNTEASAFPEPAGTRASGLPGRPPTRFFSVRFGNVLGSRGSVVPLFLEQLRYGGPLTVTHKDVKRYFMTIPEAVTLVLQASILGNGGEVFVLDMGDPVRIVDIAEELIRIHGMEPYKDIDIQITQLRPGEKLFEEILTAEEGTEASRHEKIFIARNNVKYSLDKIPEILKEFSAAIADLSPASNERMKVLLKKYVKYYQVPDAVIGKSPVAVNAPAATMIVAHPESAGNSEEPEAAAAAGS
jgi:FlaA1/EpsC-like NDP-sugar epimerase